MVASQVTDRDSTSRNSTKRKMKKVIRVKEMERRRVCQPLSKCSTWTIGEIIQVAMLLFAGLLGTGCFGYLFYGWVAAAITIWGLSAGILVGIGILSSAFIVLLLAAFGLACFFERLLRDF